MGEIAATVVGPQDLERWLGTLHETVLEAHLVYLFGGF